MIAQMHLQLFAETRNQNGQWVAEAAHTFHEKPMPVSGRLIPVMEETPCPQHLPLFGLLCDGAWESLPWSCWQRGLPDDASPQVRAISEEWGEEAFGHNHLTLQELTEKYTEISRDHRPKAKLIEHSLAEMLYALTMAEKSSVAPEDRRVVFWFY